MQIDWLTVAAQIVNFLILVWLLRRFLYQPITGAMRRREERIEARLAEAREVRAKAEADARRLREREDALEERRAALIAEARAEAEALRARLESEIRDEMEDRRAAWRAHLVAERAAFLATLQREAGTQVLEIVRDVLAEYAGRDLSETLVARFVERLHALDEGTRAGLADAAGRPGASARVETAAALDGAQKAQITRALHDILSSRLPVDYGEDPGTGLGVRLMIGEHHVEWSAVRYLERLKTELGEILDAGLRTMTPAADRARDRETA